MTRHTVLSLVVATAILLGQWLSAGHDVEHGLQSNAAHSCAICVYTDGAGPVAPFEIVSLSASPEASDKDLDVSVRGSALRYQPIRGPPPLLS